MRVALLLALALAACSAPAPAQNATAPARVTAEAAASLPPDQLADLAFRQLGTVMTAVSRPASREGGVDPTLERLVFAGAPHMASVGLCEAMRAEFSYTPSGADRPATPANLGLVRAGQVYKVVGPVEPYVELTQDRLAEENQRCAGAGPVIPASQGDLSRAYYFTFEGEALPELSLMVLQQAIADAREGHYRTVGCAANARSAPECRDPSALLGGLDMANLVAVQIAPSGFGGNRHLIRARFLIPRTAVYWSVAVEADISRPPDEAETIERLGRTEIARSEAPAA